MTAQALRATSAARTSPADWVGNMTIGGRFGLSQYNVVGGAAATAAYWGLGMQVRTHSFLGAGQPR